MRTRNQFVIKRNFTVYNRMNNEAVTGDLINEDEIEGRKFYVLRVGERVLKLSKDAYSLKRNLLTSLS